MGFEGYHVIPSTNIMQVMPQSMQIYEIAWSLHLPGPWPGSQELLEIQLLAAFRSSGVLWTLAAGLLLGSIPHPLCPTSLHTKKMNI